MKKLIGVFVLLLATVAFTGCSNGVKPKIIKASAVSAEGNLVSRLCEKSNLEIIEEDLCEYKYAQVVSDSSAVINGDVHSNVLISIRKVNRNYHISVYSEDQKLGKWVTNSFDCTSSYFENEEQTLYIEGDLKVAEKS